MRFKDPFMRELHERYEKDYWDNERKKAIAKEEEVSKALQPLYIPLASIIGLVWGLVWMWDKVTNWESLAFPYNYPAAFYNYTVVIPIKALIIIGVSCYNLTPHKKLGFILSVFSCLLYIVGIFSFFFLINKIGKKYNAGIIILLIFVSPACLSLLWFIFEIWQRS